MNSAEKKNNPTLSLCMIVKNEEAWLRTCLQSVQGLVDEIVIVDTGSSDGTLEIAKSFGARIIPHVWKNNFSEARNVSLAQASCDWILVLDADEAVSKQDHAAIRHLIQNPQKPIYYLIQTNYCPESSVLGWVPNQLKVPESKGYPGYIDSPLARLFPRETQIRFQGEIHEHVQAQQKEYPQLPATVRIHHYGKYISEETQKRKDGLYLKITEEKYKKNPQNVHVCYEMAAQYFCLGFNEEAKKIIQDALKLDPAYVRLWLTWGAIAHQEKNYAEAAQAYIEVMERDPENPSPYIFLPTILMEMRNFVLALEVLKRGHEKAAAYPAFHLNEGIVKQSLGRQKEALQCFKKALEMNPSEGLAWLNQGVSECYLGFFEQAEESFQKSIPFIRYRLEAQRRLIDLYFKTGQFEKALKTVQSAKKEAASDANLLVNEVVLLTETKQWVGLEEKIDHLLQREDVSVAQQHLLKTCLTSKLQTVERSLQL